MSKDGGRKEGNSKKIVASRRMSGIQEIRLRNIETEKWKERERDMRELGIGN